MNVTVVRDDAAPDALENLITSLDGTSSSVIFLSEFILSHGYRYDRENGRFIPTEHTDVHAGSLAPPMLLNRVVEISTYSCSRLADETSAPTRGLVSELYSRLLARYPQPYCPETSYSTVGKLVPLFTQWSMVTKGIPGVRVPIFKYGYGPEKINAEDFANPIYKSPFNFYEWRPNDPPEGITMDTFVVDRPKGEPLLGMMCGRHAAMRWLRNGSPVDPALADRLRPTLLSIKDIFSAFMGESLWFVDGEAIIFASFSHRLGNAQRFPEFKNMLAAALKDVPEIDHSVASSPNPC